MASNFQNKYLLANLSYLYSGSGTEIVHCIIWMFGTHAVCNSTNWYVRRLHHMVHQGAPNSLKPIQNWQGVRLGGLRRSCRRRLTIWKSVTHGTHGGFKSRVSTYMHGLALRYLGWIFAPKSHKHVIYACEISQWNTNNLSNHPMPVLPLLYITHHYLRLLNTALMA